MMPTSRLALVLAGTSLLAAGASAQVPDLLNALDAGGRAMATGGANAATNVDTLSTYYNPAALGYLDARAVGLTYRNLPESRTFLSGDRDNPNGRTDGRSGSQSIAHLGFATPIRELFGRGSGTLGVSYTLGGYIDDTATAATLDDDPLTITNYRLRREAKASFYNLSYGKAVNSGLAFGVGLVFAEQKVEFRETGTANDGSSPAFAIDNGGSSTGSGVGVLAGVLYTPPSTPDWTLGLSYRSPIDLSGNRETANAYDTIPGRLIAGATWRKEGYRGGKDYLLIGGQVQSFFGGDSSQYFDRETQTLFGFGVEYSVGIEQGRVPLRVGFTTVPSAGDGFSSRNAFTFGFGLRPNRYPVGLDVSYAVPDGGGYDFSIGLSYRFN